MNLKTILGWAAVAFIVWFIIEQPHTCVHILDNIRSWLESAAHGLSSFFASI